MIRKHFFDNDVDLEITRFLDSNELLDKGVKKPVLDADDAKIQEYITGNKAKETKYKDKSSLNRLQLFMSSMDPPDTRNILEIPAKELNAILCNFYMSAKKLVRKA